MDQSWGSPELTGLIKAYLSNCEHCELHPPEDLAPDLLFHYLIDLCLGLRFSFTIQHHWAATQMGKKERSQKQGGRIEVSLL